MALAWGMQAIVTESLLLREAVVLMFGSELAWGIVLFAWLSGVAAGALAGGWVAGRVRRPEVVLTIVLIGLALAGCVEIWAFRGVRGWFGAGPGERLPLFQAFLTSLVLVLPCGLFVGAAFPLASAIGCEGDERRATGSISAVYALESAGSLVGGAAFTFWVVQHLSPIQAILVAGSITAAASAALLAGHRANKPHLPVAVAATAAMMLGAALVFGDSLNERLIERRWRNLAPHYQHRAETDSPYQNLAVGRLAEQHTLYCDGQVTTDFPDPATFAPLAHFWMCLHPRPRRVLVLGGGAEGLLAEILKHPVERIDYVEPDPRQISLIEPFLGDHDRRALEDPRVTVHHEDGRRFVKSHRDQFDLVIARLAEPTSALRARFFTREFYGELRRAMTAEAVLCTTVAAGPTRLSSASARYLAGVRVTLACSFPEIIVGWGDPAHVLASTRPGLISLDPAELGGRYRQRGVKSPWFGPLWFRGATDWLEPAKVRERARELDSVSGAAVSTDLRPIVYMHRLSLWEAMTGGKSGRLIDGLLDTGWASLILVLATVALVTLTGFRLVRRAPIGWADGAVALSVGSTGMVTMSLSIVWLFAFQNLYGYVYQWIGLLVAVFMGGLVLGCWWAGRQDRRVLDGRNRFNRHRRWLIAVDLLMALAAGTMPVVLRVLGTVQADEWGSFLVRWAVPSCLLASGILGGAAFALASAVKRKLTPDSEAVAGVIVSADHAGACLGALVTGILLMPVFGGAVTAILLAGIKVLSAGIVLLASRRFIGAITG